MESERIGLLALFRALRDFRRAAKLNRRPVIAAEAARDRYEPLIESLATELGREFGVEFRRAEGWLSRRNPRVFVTTRWVADESLTKFPGWAGRLEAAVRQVADVVGPDLPAAAFAGTPTEPPAQMGRQMRAQGIELMPLDPTGDDVDLVAMSQHLSFRDRLGGDVQVRIEDDHTFLSAIASVTAD